MKMFTRSTNFFLIAFILTFFIHSANAQKVFLVLGKKKVPLPNPNIASQWVGLTTPNDTVKYFDKKGLSYSLFKANQDSIIIKRPLEYYDTSILVYGNANNFSFEHTNEKYFKENGKRYVRLIKVDKDEYKSFAYKDITSFTYPTYTGKGDGCEACILIPGVNVLYIILARNRWRAHKLDMQEWKFLIE